MNPSISVLLEHKGSTVFTVSPNITIAEAVQEMNRHRVGSVVVMAGTELAGIFTERDVLTRVVAVDLDPKKHTVAEVMTRKVLSVSLETTVDEAIEIFTKNRCRHLPVIVGGRVVGLISIGDIVKWRVREYEMEQEALRDYIKTA